MKLQIDVKSLVLGAVVGIGAILAMGAASSNPVGKYQVIGGQTKGFVMVDTQTGQAWGADWNVNFRDTGAFWDPK
jgi:hypothetical protein